MSVEICQYFLHLHKSIRLCEMLDRIFLPHSDNINVPNLLTVEVVSDLTIPQCDEILLFFSETSGAETSQKISFAEISLLVAGGVSQISIPQVFARCAIKLGINVSLRYSRHADGVSGTSMSDKAYAIYSDLLASGKLRNIVHFFYYYGSGGSLSSFSRWTSGEFDEKISVFLSELSTRILPQLPDGWIGIEFQDYTRFYLGPLLRTEDIGVLVLGGLENINGIEFRYVSIDI